MTLCSIILTPEYSHLVWNFYFKWLAPNKQNLFFFEIIIFLFLFQSITEREDCRLTAKGMRECGEDMPQRLYQLSYWRALNNRNLKNIQQKDKKKREQERANLAFKTPHHLHKKIPFANLSPIAGITFFKTKKNLCVSCQIAF